MNRLVIVGNGFDLAHGLPTSYRDFIDDYWKNLSLVNDEDDFIKLYLTFEYDSKEVNNFKDFSALVVSIASKNYPTGTINSDDGNIRVYISRDSPWKRILEFKNDFFKRINQKNIENWVDIENEYYSALKEIVKLNFSDNLRDSQLKEIKKLNKEFEDIQNLFEKYLKERIIDIFNFGHYPDFVGNKLNFPNVFKPITFIENSKEMDLFLNEFPLSYQNDIKNQFVYRGDELTYDCNLTFLTFNYTPTLNNYKSILDFWKLDNNIIHIHGFVNDSDNKINFGFGDEMDDDYKIIENFNDNEYLKNFKSFQYLHTSNYKKLLNLIDSDSFQVYLVGHSCGLSDRTLLNTIFEHQNCHSIKIFYHQKEDGTDNYTEITQNISRHFNKKKLMREKVVNKTLCQPLPQIQLPKKEK